MSFSEKDRPEVSEPSAFAKRVFFQIGLASRQQTYHNSYNMFLVLKKTPAIPRVSMYRIFN